MVLRTISKENQISKKVLSFILSGTMLTSAAAIGTVTVQPVEVNAAETNYGLMSNVQDGTILHCFDWTYNDIKAELPNIAAAGFTSVQTSPAQMGGDTTCWWWLYQPLGFYIGNDNPLGTKEELRSLCEEAHNYGIKIVVDVVANHLAGDHSNIQEDLKPDEYWHSTDTSNLGSRDTETHKSLGMPDLNTENSYVQQCVRNYVTELYETGVDGIRWDAAKHIGLPSEGDNFFASVLNDDNQYMNKMFNYGEILGGPGSSSDERNVTLMKEYNTYMSVTDDHYGKTLRDWFNGGSSAPSYANWAARGLSSDKLVYWGESHDTYSNLPTDYGYSGEIDQNVIDRAYAIAASRDGATALYFSRPFEKNKDDILLGVKGSTHFTSSEVAEVNHFHNLMYGQSEYFVVSNDCAVVCREQGAVVAAHSGSNKSVSLTNGGSTTAAGTYTDTITGNKWTVTSATITGTIGSTGIAVLVNDEIAAGSVSASPASGTSFTTDTLDVTLKANKVTNAVYTTSEGKTGSFTDGNVITIGEDTDFGDDVTVTLTAVDSDNNEVSQVYTYTKKDRSTEVSIYFDNSSYNWSQVYAYIYNTNGEYKGWPGTLMTKLSDGTTYKMVVPEEYAESCNVLFTEERSSNNRYPGSDDPGMVFSGKSMIFGSGYSWEDYDPVVKNISLTLEGDIGLNYYISISDILVNKGITAYLSGVNGDVQLRLSTNDKITSGETAGLYKLTYPLDATQMKEDVSLVIKDSSNNTMTLLNAKDIAYKNSTAVYCVQDYIDIAKSMSSLSDSLKELVSATEIYGEYASAFLDGTELSETAAAAQLPEITAQNDEISKFKLASSGELPSGVKLTGTSLILDSKTTFRIYFTAADINSFEVKVENETVTPVSKGKSYYIELKNISAQNLDEPYTAEIGDCTITFSGMTYVYNALNYSNNDKLLKTVKALYLYNQKANNFFD